MEPCMETATMASSTSAVTRKKATERATKASTNPGREQSFSRYCRWRKSPSTTPVQRRRPRAMQKAGTVTASLAMWYHRPQSSVRGILVGLCLVWLELNHEVEGCL